MINGVIFTDQSADWRAEKQTNLKQEWLLAFETKIQTHAVYYD